MPKFSAKLLYAIVGTGIVGSVSTGLYFGLGNSIYSSSAEKLGGEETSGKKISVSCENGGESIELESISDQEINEDEKQKLLKELGGEQCSNLKG